MEYFYALLFGIVQGLTEFLPISSSGHLVILHELITLDVQNELAFDVSLHLATMFAVTLFFAKDLVRYLRAFFAHLFHPDFGDIDQRMAWLLIAGSVPAGIIGLLFEETIENVFRSPIVVMVMLVAVALLFFAVERYARTHRDLSSTRFPDALIVGLAQAVALIPGTSRSGITIIAGMWRGLKRVDAARFSFLLSVPIVVAAGVKQGAELIVSRDIASSELGIYLAAFFSAFVTGWLAIRFLLSFVQHHTLKSFAVYRILLALVLFLLMF